MKGYSIANIIAHLFIVSVFFVSNPVIPMLAALICYIMAFELRFNGFLRELNSTIENTVFVKHVHYHDRDSDESIDVSRE